MDINFRKRRIRSLEELFEKEVIDFLENYRWRGNVRELVNLVEYLSIIYEGKKFGLSSLHYYMLEDEREYEQVFLHFHELWVLEEIEKNKAGGIGRNALTQLAKKQNLELGEGKIRGIIKKLEEQELIEQQDGKRGCIINKRGIEALKNYASHG